MTISEKLVAVAENIPKIYERGNVDGKEQTAEKLKPYIEDVSLKKLYEEGNFILGGMSRAIGDISDKQYTSFGGTDTIKIIGYVDLELELVSPEYQIIIDDVIVQERSEFEGVTAKVLFEYKGYISDSIKLAKLTIGTTHTFNRFLIRTDYAEGFEAGKAESGGSDDGGYDKGYTDGQEAERSAFWDIYQDNGNRTVYQNAFSGAGWNDETFTPKYDMKPTSAVQMYKHHEQPSYPTNGHELPSTQAILLPKGHPNKTCDNDS